MDVQQVLHMKGGEDHSSYAKNSSFQILTIMKVNHVLEQSIQEFCRSNNTPTKCIRVADLGCASGPNTLLTIREIIDCIDKECRNLNNGLPLSIQFFLNDLESNDFNTIFRSLPNFYKQLEKPGQQSGRSCFIAAMPGSFYGRLFPDNFIHFMHSSTSLHWLSESPRALVTEKGSPLNKGNVYIAKTSPSNVHDAYLDQFERDFAYFLRMHAVEMVTNGHLFLTLHSNNDDSDCYSYQDILGMALADMVMEGLIEEATLDNFNLPLYEPSLEEVRHVIEKEGSFEIRHLETIKLGRTEMVNNSKELISNGQTMGEFFASNLRAVVEPVLSSHFGEGVMDNLFRRCAKKLPEYVGKMKNSKEILVVSLWKA